MSAPTASGGDGAGPRFCAPLPTSPARFRGIDLKTLDEFPSTASFFTPFFCWGPSVKALGSPGGFGWELRRLYEIFILSCVWSGESWSELERLGEKW